MLKLKDIEADFIEDLTSFLYDSPITQKHIYRLNFEPMPVAPSSHRYQATLNERNRGSYVVYKNRRFGEIYKRPHKKVILFEQFDEYRLFAKLFEKVVRTNVPEAQIEFKYGE